MSRSSGRAPSGRALQLLGPRSIVNLGSSLKRCLEGRALQAVSLALGSDLHWPHEASGLEIASCDRIFADFFVSQDDHAALNAIALSADQSHVLVGCRRVPAVAVLSASDLITRRYLAGPPGILIGVSGIAVSLDGQV